MLMAAQHQCVLPRLIGMMMTLRANWTNRRISWAACHHRSDTTHFLCPGGNLRKTLFRQHAVEVGVEAVNRQE